MTTAPKDDGSALARMARNGATTASADILAKIFSVVFFSLVARRFSGDDLGYYVFAQAVASLVWSFGSLGLDRMATRDIARQPEVMRDIAVPMAVAKMTLSTVAVVLIIAVLAAFGQPQLQIVLVLVHGLSIAVGLAGATAMTVFMANERMEHVFIAKVPFALASTGLGILLLLRGGGLVQATLVSTAGGTVAWVAWAWWIVIRHYGRPHPHPRFAMWPAMFRKAVPFGLQEMLGQVIFRFDTVLLALVASSAVVGDYGAAYRMVEATLFIVWSTGFSVMPMYSYIPLDPRERPLTRVLEGSLKLVLIAMAPIATVYLVCAHSIIDLVYGVKDHGAAVGILQLLAPAVAIYGVGHLAGLLVLVRRPGKTTVLLSGGVTLANLAVCGVLIPLFHAHGAAISTIIAESLLALGGLGLCLPVVGAPRLGWILLTPLAAAVAMGFAMAPVADRLWLALPVGMVVYGAVLLALEAPRLRGDVAFFRELRARRPDAAAIAMEEPIGV